MTNRDNADTMQIMAGKIAMRPAKIDVGKALAMRLVQGLSMQQIANHYNCSHQAVSEALSRFKEMFANFDVMPTYREQKTGFLENVEFNLLAQLCRKDKQDGASLNNVAYAYTAVANQNRLEKGQSTSNISYPDLTSDIASIADQRNQLLVRKAQLQAQIAQLSGAVVDTVQSADVFTPVISNPNDCKGLDDPLGITPQT